MKSTRRKKPRYVVESRRIQRNKTKIDDLTDPVADTELSAVGITDSYKCSEALDINHKCTADNKTEGTRELFYGAERNSCEQSQMQDSHTPEHVFFPRVQPSQKGKVKRSHSSRIKSAQRKKLKSSYISVLNQESRELSKIKMKDDECTDDTELAVEAGK
jgi:hypothetical protein